MFSFVLDYRSVQAGDGGLFESKSWTGRFYLP
jgi:hypothetical protein